MIDIYELEDKINDYRFTFFISDELQQYEVFSMEELLEIEKTHLNLGFRVDLDEKNYCYTLSIMLEEHNKITLLTQVYYYKYGKLNILNLKFESFERFSNSLIKDRTDLTFIVRRYDNNIGYSLVDLERKVCLSFSFNSKLIPFTSWIFTNKGILRDLEGNDLCLKEKILDE